MYFLYMIKDKEERLYTGITNNPTRRLYEHNNKQGSVFTKNSSEFSIVFLEEYSSATKARQREIQIKKWTRAKKENIIKLYEQGNNIAS